MRVRAFIQPNDPGRSMSGRRHVIQPAPGKGMATQQTAYGEPAAAQQAVSGYCDVGVLAACGLKTAATGDRPREA